MSIIYSSARPRWYCAVWASATNAAAWIYFDAIKDYCIIVVVVVVIVIIIIIIIIIIIVIINIIIILCTLGSKFPEG